MTPNNRNVQNIFDKEITLNEKMESPQKITEKRVYVPWTICEEDKIKEMAKTNMSNKRKLAALNKACNQNRTLGSLTQKLHRTRLCRKRAGYPKRH